MSGLVFSRAVSQRRVRARLDMFLEPTHPQGAAHGDFAGPNRYVPGFSLKTKPAINRRPANRKVLRRRFVRGALASVLGVEHHHSLPEIRRKSFHPKRLIKHSGSCQSKVGLVLQGCQEVRAVSRQSRRSHA